jgi:putative Mn2+ efflux pump MntP
LGQVLLLLALILPLGLDTFAVASALGAAGVAARRRLTFSLVFLCFEGGMPLIGLLLGANLGPAIGDIAGYGAVTALIGVGLYLLLADGTGDERRLRSLATARGFVLLTAGIAISLDELAIGFVFGLLDVPIVPALVAIAVQAFVVSQLGFELGGRVAEHLRERAEQLAGVVLIAIGLLVLWERLSPGPLL